MELLIAPKKARCLPYSYVGQWFLCLHIDGVVLTAPDAKIETGKKIEINANLSTRWNNHMFTKTRKRQKVHEKLETYYFIKFYI